VKDEEENDENKEEGEETEWRGSGLSRA
jgi:hypothetical protein